MPTPALDIILFGGRVPALQADFVNGVYSLGPTRTGSFLALPGASYSGSVSGTGATVRTALMSSGAIVNFANGVPRITDLGILIEEARTNSFLNSAVGVTQTVTTTAASWTLQLRGTGSIVLSGGATGTLSGTGANNLVSLTLTALAAPTVLTVAGSVTNVQFEAGAILTSYIPTAGAPVTRAADIVVLSPLTFPAVGTVLTNYTMPKQPSAVRGYTWIITDAGTSRFAMRGCDVVDPQPTVIVGNGSNTTLGPVTAVTGQALRTALAYDTTAAQLGLSVNGVDATNAQQASSTTLTGAAFNLGNSAGLGNSINSYIQRLVIVPTFYSSAQRIAATQ